MLGVEVGCGRVGLKSGVGAHLRGCRRLGLRSGWEHTSEGAGGWGQGPVWWGQALLWPFVTVQVAVFSLILL